jgi:hypothetical protein
MSYTVGTAVLASPQRDDEALARGLVQFPHVMAAGPSLDSRSEAVFANGIKAILRSYGLQSEAWRDC